LKADGDAGANEEATTDINEGIGTALRGLHCKLADTVQDTRLWQSSDWNRRSAQGRSAIAMRYKVATVASKSA
jgi:hypothetical protein